MSPDKLIRGVFGVIGCAVLMAILYYILFGGKAVNFSSTTYQAQGDWEGALFHASRQIEYPISKYYYSYCYLPNVHMEDGVDISSGLGGTLTRSAYAGNLMRTESDLTSDSSDNVSFNNNSSHWSTGWK